MIIGVLSDTHIPRKAKVLPEIVLNIFEDVDHIIHAGDIMSMDAMCKPEEFAPVTAVTGNTDPPELIERLREKEILTFGSFNFGIVHGRDNKGTTKRRNRYYSFRRRRKNY